MLWVVGRIFYDFAEYLGTLNIPYGILWDDDITNVDPPSNAPVIRVNYSDLKNVGAQLSAQKIDVSAILVAGYENYVLPAAYIADYFKVPGLSINSAEAATNKAIMRQRFDAFDPNLSPAHAEVASWEDVLDFMGSHDYPVMLKPASLMKSLLITKSSDLQELQQNYEYTTREINRLYAKFHIVQPPRILIEEFVTGSMHTVAAFVDQHGNPEIVPGIVDCETAADAGFDDTFLYSRTLPSALPEAQQESILQTARNGVKALGLTNCPAHIELILTKNGPKIIEIGARVGGYRTRMYAYTKGIDMQRAIVDLAFGKQPDLHATSDHSIVVIELFPSSQGSFKNVASEDKISGLPSYRHFSVKFKVGSTVGKSSQGFQATAVLILGNDNHQQLMKDVEFVKQNVKINLAG